MVLESELILNNKIIFSINTKLFKILDVNNRTSNKTFEIDVWRYFHPDATKTVYLQAGIHGIELIGIPVVHEFMKGIE
jgi:predicted deacylase